MSMVWNEHAAKRRDLRMRVGERIDMAVLHDARSNAGRERVFAQGSFHEIAREIADERFRIVAGQKQMREVVHPRLRYAA